jgi:hypothetical protein
VVLAMNKEMIIGLVRGPAVKVVTRLMFYLVVPLLIKWGFDETTVNTSMAQIAEGLGALLSVGIGVFIDYLHHRADTKKKEGE